MGEKRTQGILGLVSQIRERGNLLIERELARRGVTGIAPAHGRVLSALYASAEPLMMSDLVERAGRVKSTITSMVNTLEKHGYVQKSPSPADGRATLVSLTAKGRDFFPVYKEISAITLKAVYADMPMEERERLVSLLEQLDGNLRRNLV